MILALRASFAAGQSTPDVYYYDNDMSEFITAGYAADLSNGVNWAYEEPRAKEYFNRPGPAGKGTCRSVEVVRLIDMVPHRGYTLLKVRAPRASNVADAGTQMDSTAVTD